jgi:Na+-transporting NADH:ubiquinone oxidoreductase subunit C
MFLPRFSTITQRTLLERGGRAVSKPPPKNNHSNAQVYLFMIILSVTCAVILSLLASALEKPQEIAKELDRSEQMLIAARIYTHEGYFQIKNDKGEYVPAKYAGNGRLEPGTVNDYATQNQILDIYKSRLVPFFVDNKGNVIKIDQSGIDFSEYISQYKKVGYYKQPDKLIYEILPNPSADQKEKEKPIGYIIPVNGYGLWDAIYGYIAIEPDGDTVIGISWYDQKETPGLGAVIVEKGWQSLFFGKKIFQQGPDGKSDYKTSPIGINVLKGKVDEVLGDIPKAKSAVDGMSGATLTGNGVTSAYKDVLSEYRPFFIKLKNENIK